MYNSPTIFNDLLECLSAVSANVLKNKLNDSKFVGIGIDESTDRAQEKHCPSCTSTMTEKLKPLVKLSMMELQSAW